MKYLKRAVGRTVLVTSTGGTFKGTLAHADSEAVVLDHATAVGRADGNLDGQVVVPGAAVTWVQVV